MTVNDEINQKGLFGGLMYERRLNKADLLRHINRQWAENEVVSFSDIGEWRRGGAETYVATGRLNTEDGRTLDVIGKAFVGTGLPPDRQQERWEERRQLLHASGIATPKVFATYPALTIEEFIDQPMPPAAELTPELAFQAGQIAGILAEMGFWPIAMLGDMRVSGGRVSYVDFGSDLGGATNQSRYPEWIDKIRQELVGDSKSEFDFGLGLSGKMAT